MADPRKPILGLVQDDIILMRVTGSVTRQRRCRNCHSTPFNCDRSGCGQRKEIGWRRVNGT
jgi:hypothetical protein